MADDVRLREVQDDDLPILFEHQLDPDANRMAAFTVADPSDHAAFVARWQRIRANESGATRTIVAGGTVAGSILVWRDPELPGPEVSYWLGKEHWGRGIATAALAEFLTVVTERPLYGRCVADNLGSRRVLEKCGFELLSEETAFATGRGEEVVELIFELRQRLSRPAPSD
jgi:RimJ/RimL family protein N-acetyltransferase